MTLDYDFLTSDGQEDVVALLATNHDPLVREVDLKIDLVLPDVRSIWSDVKRSTQSE